jgi:sugar phosphate isomerase/epimerase
MAAIQLGVIVGLTSEPEKAIQKAHDLGFPTCQVSCWQEELFVKPIFDRLQKAAAEYQVEITTLWTGTPGRTIWNFIEGPSTIGLVPEWMRAPRLAALKKGADMAKYIGVPSITTHVGFIPENPADPLYIGTLSALKEIAAYCRERGLSFWFETGQETAVTLLRAIEDIDLDNVGVNLDPANLILYGKANPVDALDIIGKYVRGVHAKDGEYPTDGRNLGKEKALGEGRVNFPALLPKLKALGFQGALTIEREISGPKQIEDIKKAKDFLTKLL